MEFGVGEYKTRDGRQAVVEFVMPKPAEKELVVGRVFWNGKWSVQNWDMNGSFLGPAHGDCGWDLMPPVRYKWRWVSLHLSGGWCPGLPTAVDAASDAAIGYLRAELTANDRIDVTTVKWFTTDEALAEMRKDSKP